MAVVADRWGMPAGAARRSGSDAGRLPAPPRLSGERPGWAAAFRPTLLSAWRQLPEWARAVLAVDPAPVELITEVPGEPGAVAWGDYYSTDNLISLAWPLAGRLPADLQAALLGHEWGHCFLHRTDWPRWLDEARVDALAFSWGFAVYDLRDYVTRRVF
jgi:hypothetical protein